VGGDEGVGEETLKNFGETSAIVTPMNKGYASLLILGIVALVLIGGGWALTLKNSTHEHQDSPATFSNQRYTLREVSEITINGKGAYQYALEDPSLQKINIPDELNTRLNSGFAYPYLLIYPLDKNILALAISQGPCPQTNTIYSYNLETHQVLRLAQFAGSPFDSGYCVEAYPLGFEGSKLIIKFHVLETGGPCDDPWSSSLKFGYLDLKNVSSGVHEYIPSPEKIKQAEVNIRDCVQSLEGS
jgi:hypothetical protein